MSTKFRSKGKGKSRQVYPISNKKSGKAGYKKPVVHQALIDKVKPVSEDEIKRLDREEVVVAYTPGEVIAMSGFGYNVHERWTIDDDLYDDGYERQVDYYKEAIEGGEYDYLGEESGEEPWSKKSDSEIEQLAEEMADGDAGDITSWVHEWEDAKKSVSDNKIKILIDEPTWKALDAEKQKQHGQYLSFDKGEKHTEKAHKLEYGYVKVMHEIAKKKQDKTSKEFNI